MTEKLPRILLIDDEESEELKGSSEDEDATRKCSFSALAPSFLQVALRQNEWLAPNWEPSSSPS